MSRYITTILEVTAPEVDWEIPFPADLDYNLSLYWGLDEDSQRMIQNQLIMVFEQENDIVLDEEALEHYRDMITDYYL